MPPTKSHQPVTYRLAVGEQGLNGVDLETESCERRSQTVVQVVAEAATLLLPGDDELFLGVAQILEQRRRVHNAADLVCEISHQGLFGRAQRPARPAQHAHRLAVRDQRELLGRLLRSAAARQQPPGPVADLGPAQPQASDELVGQRVQQGRTVGRVTQPAAGLAEHLGRRRPATVGEAVHSTLERVAQRRERNGHDCGGRQGQPGCPAVAQHDPDPGHDHGVEHGQDSREQQVGECLVDCERDVVEPALQHRHGDGDRNGKGHDREHPGLDPRSRHERQQGQRQRERNREDQHLLALQIVTVAPPVHQRADRERNPETRQGQCPDRQEVDQHRPVVRHTDGVLCRRRAAPRGGPGPGANRR